MRRSKISPSKIANTGVNPYTGEYLSAGERKLLFQKRNVSSANVFKKSGALVKTNPSTITPDINVTVLSKRVFVLENDVSFLAKTLNKEAELEKKAQKQYEKDVEKVEEKKLRSGEEKKLEKKITKGLISPVKAVGKKAGGVLGTLMELFMTLLGGWLTNQGLEAIKANAEGNIDKLEEIKKNVTETLATVGGIFALLSGGLLVIGAIVKSLAKRILKFAWRKTFGRILNPKPPTPTNKPTGTKPVKPVKPLTPTNKPPTTPRSTRPPVKPVSPGGPKSPILGPNGKPVPTQVQGTTIGRAPSVPKSGQGITPKVTPKVSLTSRVPKIKGGGIAGGLFFMGAEYFFGDQVSDFGLNLGKILGAPIGVKNIKSESDKDIIKKLEEFEKNKDKDKRKQVGFMDTVELFTGPLGDDPGLYIREAKIRGLIDVSNDGSSYTYKKKVTPEPVTPEPVTPEPVTPTPTPAVTPAVTTPVPGEMPAAQISSPSSSIPAPGPVSSAGNTTVIYKKVGGSGGQMQGQPLKSGSATDVPLIASADPSNFYTMYSQLLYNVVG